MQMKPQPKNHLKLQIILIITIFNMLRPIYSNFAIQVPSVTPSTARSLNSNYLFSFNSNQFTSDFDIRILFEQSRLPLVSPTNCKFTLNDGAQVRTTGICRVVSNELIFENLAITQSIRNYSVQFTSVGANFAGTTTLTFRYFTPGTSTQIASISPNYVQISFTDAAMTCRASSDSDIVGTNGTVFSLSYEPNVSIPADSIMQIRIAPWGPFSRSNFISSNTTRICGSCALSVPSSNGNLFQQLKYTNLYSTLIQAASNNQIILNDARNPSSAQPIAISMTLLVVSGGTENSFMSCSTTLQVTMANTMADLAFTTTNKAIGAQNILTLQIRLKNPVARTAHLRISTSLALSFQYNLIFPQGIIPNQVSSASSDILIRNFTAGTNDNRIFSLNNFTLTNPPFANKAVSASFTVQNFIDPNFFVIQTGSVQIISSLSTIIQTSIQTGGLGINTRSSYNISFININPLISGSFILLIVPTDMSTSGASCSLTSISSSCIVLNSTTFKTNLNVAVNSGQNLTIQLTNFINPPTTTQTNSFSIHTFYNSEQTPVDFVNTNITVTGTSVPLGSVLLQPANKIVGASSVYTVTIQNRNQLPASSSIVIILPSTSYGESSIALSSFRINGIAVANCFMGRTGLVLNFTLCINSNVPPNSQIIIAISNVINPTSTKPTDSWIVRTFYNNKQMQYLSSGITTQMETPANINNFKVTPFSPTVNVVTSYKFQVTFAYRQTNNHRIQIEIPSGVSINSGFQCSTTSADYSVGCLNNNPTTLLARISYNIVNYTNLIQFSVTNVQNYWLASILTFSMKTTTNDTSFYYVEQGSSTINYQPVTLSVSIATNNKIVLTGQSQVSVTINTPFVLNQASDTSLISITIAVPNDLTPVANTCLLSYTSANCALSSTRFYTITQIGDFPTSLNIVFRAQTQFFVQTGNFDIKLTYNNSFIGTNAAAVLQSYCTSPCKQCGTSPTQCITCLQTPYTQNVTLFPLNSTCLTACPSTYFLNSGVCQQCDTLKCLQCSGTSIFCTACNINRFLYNNTCPSVCPGGFYPSSVNRQCLSCQNPCLQCTTSADCTSCIGNHFLDLDNRCRLVCQNVSFLGIDGTCQACTNNCLSCSIILSNCTSCQQPEYKLSANRCVQTCEDFFYNSGNSTCQPCLTPCLTCTSATSCKSCRPNFLLYNLTICTETCPPGTIQRANTFCQTCDQGCGTCAIISTNCTSCIGSYLYFQFRCLLECPQLTYPQNKTCVTCFTPCITCTALPSQCLSCSGTLLLLGNSCVPSCPATGYYKSGVNCEQCIPNCLQCTNSVSCNICQSTFFLHQNTCLDKCPPLTYPYNRTCTTCIVPCVTCRSSPQLCLSCIEGLLLLDEGCVQSCPATGYYKNGTTCVQCVLNCLQCSNSIACSVCKNGFYVHQGECVTQCPTNAPIIQNRTCTTCASECATCELTPNNCTTCAVFFYKYQYTCVSSCPIAYYSNSATYECQDGLTSKIAFFPILIIGFIVVGITIISKCFTPTTSLFTVLASLFGILQVAIWIYFLALLAAPIKQPDIDYTMPIILTVIPIVAHFVYNGVFYYVNSGRLIADPYVRQWCKNNINYYVLQIFRFSSIPISHKWYRLCYSRFFNIFPLSVPYFNRSNVFTVATIFSILCLLLCEIPIIIASFSLVYLKLLKDQMFYTCIESLIVTIAAALFALIDIYKSDQFFEQNQYVKTKKYIDKVKDSSQNHLQDGFEVQRDQGSIYGEKFGMSGGKLVYQKKDASSLNQLFFQEEQSQITDALQSGHKDFKDDKSSAKKSPRKMFKINIFNPILEEQAEYYDQQKYQDSQFLTQAQKEQQLRKNKSAVSEQSETEQQVLKGQNLHPFTGQGNKASKGGRGGKYKTKSHMKKHMKAKLKNGRFMSIDGQKPEKHGYIQQKDQIYQKGIMDSLYGQNLQKLKQDKGYNTLYSLGDPKQQQNSDIASGDQNDDADNKSLLEYRQRKQHWNSILTRRQKIAEKIFGKTPLQKIVQPLNASEQDDDINNLYGVTGSNFKSKGRRKARKAKDKGKHNKQLQQIYLQRLTQLKKKSTKNIIQSNKALKYQF